jgi:hypothetical protein
MTRFVAILLLLPSLVAATPLLDEDLDHYVIFAMRRLRLKNLAVEPPGCNVGVNCAQPSANSACGVLRGKDASIPPLGQVAADHLCATGSFFQVFRNGPSCSPDCTMISSPGPAGDCTTPFTTPIVDDLDGDGNPSCSSDCDVDFEDFATACEVSLPFPPCDPARPIVAEPDADCGADDVLPGNFRCDLAAGTYGSVFVRDGARLDFGPGTTVACRLKAGKATRVTSAGSATVLVPAPGSIKINNASDVGGECRALYLVTERGVIHFGRNGDYTLDACSIAGKLNLGHANNLRGTFIGLDTAMDFNNDARCCSPAEPPVTSTTVTGSSTSSSTAPPTSTTTNAGGTTTTGPGSTTTSTTLPGGGAFTRTIGFYKTHPAVTQQILDAHGPLSVCGRTLTDTDVAHAHSALEALCGSPQGDQRLQLVRQLTGAALSTAAGGAQFDPRACNAVCQDPAATAAALSACIDAADAFNNSGDGVTAPWDPAGPADPRPCDLAAKSPCTILDPSACASP